MIRLDLMPLADLLRPVDIVQELIRQTPTLRPPVPLEEIAEAVGIKDIQYAAYDGFEGALVADVYKTKGVILIDNSISGRSGYCRRRYGLGHELGHFMLPLHGYEMACSPCDIHNSSTHDKIEQEANVFSSNLLMPEALFCKDHDFEKKPSLQNMRNLALRYEVSFEACANRYVEKHADPVMMVFHKDKKFRYFRKSKHFPFYFFQKPKKNAPAPALSLTQKSNFHDKEESIFNDCVDSSIWFSESKDYELPPEVIEEVYVQKQGFSMTLLTFENEILEIE